MSRRSTDWPTSWEPRESPSTATAPARSRCSTSARSSARAPRAAAATAAADRELGDRRGLCPAAHAGAAAAGAACFTGETREKVTGCGSLYVTINEDDFGPRELFANMGKAGGCASASTEALGRLISLAFRYGAPPEKIAKQLKGIRCHVPLGLRAEPDPLLPGRHRQGSGRQVQWARRPTAEHGEVQLEMPIAYAQGACPDCGSAIEHEGGCMVCRACGYSKCA